MSTAITPSVPTTTGTIRGTGILYKEYGEGTEREIGAHRGDVKFTVDREFRHIDFNGQYGKIEGNNVITKSEPMVEFDLLELSYQNFEDCFAGLVVTDEGEYHKIAEDLAIAAGDYHENVAWVGETHAAKYAAIIVFNALGNNKIEMAIKDKDDIIVGTKFEGHYGSATQTTPPWEIRIED